MSQFFQYDAKDVSLSTISTWGGVATDVCAGSAPWKIADGLASASICSSPI
jgi:hypothetical protein